MNLFDLVGMLGGVIGIVLGARFGCGAAGWMGGVIGAAVGGIGGFLSGHGLVGATFGLGILRERQEKRRRLSPRFGRYWASERSSEWQNVKEQLAGGKEVRGKVVLEMHFGRFVDIGCGFPALLKAVEERGTAASKPPATGEEVEGLVLEFQDGDREIILTRSARRWLVYEDVPVGYLVGQPPLREDGTAIYVELTNSTHARFRERLHRERVIRCHLSSVDGLAPVLVEQRQPFSVHISPAPPA